jgi:RNA polymerase sigma-70 factor (family 1)
VQNKNKNNLTLKEYSDLFDNVYKPLCLFANKYIESLEVSKDIVQDVFVKIWEDKIEFQNKNAIKSYLYTSVKNKSLDYLKSKFYKSTDFLSIIKLENLQTEPFFLRELVIVETSNIIEKAINTLPNKCAKIIKLSLNGLTNVKIANELGLSINTIKAQKRIAYKRLKPLLKGYFVFIGFVFTSN